MTKRNSTLACTLAGALFAAGCAGTPANVDFLAAAETALASAEHNGAHMYSAFEFNLAKRTLKAAQALNSSSTDVHEQAAAQHLAERALVDAELAEARTLEIKSSDALTRVSTRTPEPRFRFQP